MKTRFTPQLSLPIEVDGEKTADAKPSNFAPHQDQGAVTPANFSIDRILEELNDAQREAVQHPAGPLAIIAGAGTGKTRVITFRIAYLIAAKLAKPNEILALTFTDKAAAEMEERVDVLVPYSYTDMTIATFHSFGDSLVREFAVDLGLDPDFKLMTQAEQALFLREHLFKLPLKHYRPLSNPTKFLHDLLRHFSRAKDEDISPAEYLEFAEKNLAAARQQSDDAALILEAEKQVELAKCYEAYQKLLVEASLSDFGDQITHAIRLLRESPDVRRRLQQRYRYILVDEFQDTNYAQFQLVKELAAAHRNITVVADDDQSIYKFRGAAISNILNFSDTYPDAKYVVLTQNYRSTQAILDASYKLIRHNDPDRLEVKQKINKKLVGRVPGGKPVEHLHFDTLSAEAEAVAETIRQKIASEQFKYGDFCILVRSNSAADPYLRALAEKKIPHRFSGTRGLYQREEIRLLIAFLKTLADPRDSQSLYHLALSEIYRMPMADLQPCLSLHDRTNHPLISIFRKPAEFEWSEPLSAEGRVTMAKIVSDHDKYLEKSRQLPAYALLYHFLKDTGYLSRLAAGESAESDYKLRNLAKFFNTVQNYSHFTASGDAAFFAKHLDLMRDFGDDPGLADADLDEDAVHVLTIHKAKGLEFPVVFMVGLVAQKFPTAKRNSTIELPEALIKDHLPEGDSHLQEERRLFYVGMTRAQRELYLTSSRDHGGAKPRKVSRFVHEAVDHAHADEDYLKRSPLESLARFELTPQEMPPADGVIPADQLLTLDSHKIDDYLTCPLKYKYARILRVPIEMHHTIIYGKAIHEAVRKYNQCKLQNQPVSEDDLLRVFKANWHSEGFISREHEDQRFAYGQEVLKRFFAQQEAGGTVPAYVEEQFKFRLGNNLIVGRWDRIDELPDGSVYVIDYKSSEVNDPEKVREQTVKSLQLRLYAIAYEQRFNRPVTGWRLHFLDTGLIGESPHKAQLLEKTKKDVLKAAEGIRQRDYTPDPGPVKCPSCAYQDICPAAER
ncbi:MAG: ATP-dependent helicase [candidate division KSB1 bacterium]|nr:ATP-dependent helicase [candidate division KSB1 bacterium]MDZ7369209.1 ATP-dependent helicase [candidate division KSB1 bacterium]MDZ7407213.1 ATP-dependent helicase [candidate division KSB1 bacterium]